MAATPYPEGNPQKRRKLVNNSATSEVRAASGGCRPGPIVTLNPVAWRVLIVDDDEIVRASLASLLKRSGYEVECAASGEEALRMLSAARYQVLLTDWQMPNMDGLELCRKVRLEHRKADVYLIILTMRAQEHDQLLGLAAGADDYVFKGDPPAAILERLDAARRG